MAELGWFSLLLGLFLSSYAILVDFLGTWRKDDGLIKSARNATIASLLCLTVAMTALWVLLIKSDFSVVYVAEHTAKALPVAYKISALWAGSAGSLLLWLWFQVGFVVIVFCRSETNQRVFVAGARTIANLVSVFFFLILTLDKNPFVLSTQIPADGAGLNPLLQHPAMVLHPPILFVGYAGFVVPFAWAFALLKSESQQLVPVLFKQARSWILWAWLFLTTGIVLGAWWAYEELGWGGYWAWDPVENASLLPWLTATALLHCGRIYNKRSSISVWTIVLSLVTFSLCIFGRFVTKYLGALLASVHAFTERGLGILFLVLLVHIWVLAAILMFRKYRKGKLASLDKVRSGHKFIVVNNWLLLLLTFVIFAGTLFPFFSGLFGKQISLKPEYFTKITAPGGLVFLLLLGICPYLVRYGISKSWRTTGAVIVAVAALVVWLLSHKLALICFILCGFAVINLCGDFIARYLKSRDKNNTQAIPRLNLRWCGARIVHIGVVLVFLGIAGSGGYSIEKQAALMPGEKMDVSGFDITFDGLKANHGPNFTAVTAEISVHKDSDLIAKLNPSQAFYHRSGKRTSEVDIKRTLAYDLYTALTQVDNRSRLINLTVLVKPLINWIWIGSIISISGVVLVLISFYRQKAVVSQGPEKGVQ
ncbi:MAG: heme lyase CcmF/NrfE family subunit [Planctomycetota bacterium]|jgi:cytochrome c-type biogenesis protein CcmF